MTKDEYRKQMKQLRKELSDDKRKKYNDDILNTLISMECIKSTQWLYTFVSYDTEADTIELIRYYLEGEGRGSKRIAVPKVKGQEMDFYEISSMNELKPGYRGILEPEEKRPVIAEAGVMIMPGLVFDRKLNRIGYGGGYYDRYISKYGSSKLLKTAIAYDFQIIDGDIQADLHDIKPDIIITEKSIYN